MTELALKRRRPVGLAWESWFKTGDRDAIVEASSSRGRGVMTNSAFFFRLAVAVGIVGVVVLLFGTVSGRASVANFGAVLIVGGTAILGIVASLFAIWENKSRY